MIMESASAKEGSTTPLVPMASLATALNVMRLLSLQSLACLSNVLSAHRTKEATLTTTWNAHARQKTSNTSTAPASVLLDIDIIKIQQLKRKSARCAPETLINLDLILILNASSVVLMHVQALIVRPVDVLMDKRSF